MKKNLILAIWFLLICIGAFGDLIFTPATITIWAVSSFLITILLVVYLIK